MGLTAAEHDRMDLRERGPRHYKPQLLSQRGAFMCVIIFGLCVVAAYPISNEGYVDDFSYAHSALLFAQTGKFVYDVWATALLGWLVPWGALFIKIFGFSFNVMRFAALPIAMSSVYLFHRVLVRFEVSEYNAIFGTLLLTLSPMYFPLTTSFMTDVPGMLVLLICVYMCQRAVAAEDARSTIIWLISAAILNVLAGTVRQNVWVGALVMVPSTGWFLRRRRGVLPVSIASALVSLGAMMALYYWFSTRPYFFSDPATSPGMHHSIKILVDAMVKMLLCVLLLLIPVLAAWWPTARKFSHGALLRILFALGLLAAALAIPAHRGRLGIWTAPWLPCTVSRFGNFDIEQIDQLVCSSVTYPMWLRVALTILTVAAVIITVEQLANWKWRLRLQNLGIGEVSLFWILGPATFCYALLLIPRASSTGVLDKYVIFFLPFAIASLLLVYQRSFRPKVPVISFIVLALFAIDAVGDTHDYYADARAGDIAIAELLAAGVPRTAISRSINSDGWVQVLINGYLHRLETSDVDRGPTPPPPRKPLAVACSTYMEPRVPVVQPEYYVVFSPSSCLKSSPYPPVRYRAWLPPFNRQEYIEQPIYSEP